MSRLMKYVVTFLLWRNYKVLIVSLLLLILAIVIISMMHSDYLTWAQMQDPIVPTGQSFIYKYLAYLALIALFIGGNHYANKRMEQEEAKQPSSKNKALEALLSIKARHQEKQSAKAKVKEASEDLASDPFANIRKKDKLRSQADVIIAAKAEKGSKHQ